MAATKEQSIATAPRTLVGDLVADFVTACQSSVRNKDNSIVWDHLEMEGGGQGVRKNTTEAIKQQLAEC
jgi:hypothetical protein